MIKKAFQKRKLNKKNLKKWKLSIGNNDAKLSLACLKLSTGTTDAVTEEGDCWENQRKELISERMYGNQVFCSLQVELPLSAVVSNEGQLYL